MIAFAFSFLAGRYHATPWGRHVNEADIAWPPEPVRILRALTATWWRKGDHAMFSKEALDSLIDALATELPVYHLPDAVHAHVRAFMPAPVNRRLIFDAFVRVEKGSELIVAWPTVTLSPGEASLADHLLQRIGYLGRAESWVDARVADDWDGAFNAASREYGGAIAGATPVDLVAPLSPRAWESVREQLMEDIRHTRGAKARVLARTLPEKLCDAIACDTSDWHEAGWSSPPPLQKIVYDRPTITPLPPARPRKAARAVSAVPGRPQVARYILAGRPQPRLEEALRIGETARLALMAKCRSGAVPRELSGRDERGPLRDDPLHAHAFFLPEDADCDGEIDHLVIYSRVGFSDAARGALDRLTRLWIEHRRADDEGVRGRKEWRLALEDIAAPSAFTSFILGRSPIWRSVTPLLKPRFDQTRPTSADALVESYRGQILLEWSRRFPGNPAPQVDPIRDDPDHPEHFILRSRDGRMRRTVSFARTRGRRGGRQPDAAGGYFSLTFPEAIEGPIALGWGAHFGLGLFEKG